MSRTMHHRWALTTPLLCCICLLFVPSAELSATSFTKLLTRETKLLNSLQKLSQQVTAAESAMQHLTKQSQTTQYRLRENERKITALDVRLSEQKEHLRTRLRALHRLSKGGFLRLVLDANNEAELLRRLMAFRRLLKRDRNEFHIYRDEHQALSKLRVDLRPFHAIQQKELAKATTLQKKLTKARRTAKRRLATIRRDRKLQQKLGRQLNATDQRLLNRIQRLDGTVRKQVGFAAQRGKLPWPIKGQLITRRLAAKAANPPLWQLRKGLTFASPAKQRVRAIHEATVRIAQPVDGYGRLVLLDHGDSYYSLYAYLSTLAVSTGNTVKAGTILGRAGNDPLRAKPGCYFELRHREHLVETMRRWLR